MPLTALDVLKGDNSVLQKSHGNVPTGSLTFIFTNTMTTLIDIQNQIALLQKQAEEIKAQEFNQTVQEIKAKMAAFGITLADLDGGKNRPRKAGAAKSGNPAPAKYRGPNGETWSGRGLMPRWLAALVAQGQSKESFAI
jgi:DNA-binding protein H-NS